VFGLVCVCHTVIKGYLLTLLTYLHVAGDSRLREPVRRSQHVVVVPGDDANVQVLSPER